MKHHPSSAPALTRGLQLLEQLALDGQSSLEKLAARNGWPKSSVLRCLQTLEQAGAVRQDPASKRWQALRRLQLLDGPAIGPLESARKKLPGIAERSGHCAELYQLKDGGLILFDRAEPESTEVTVKARIGFQRDLKEWEATALIAYAYAAELTLPDKVWCWKKGKKKKLSPEKRDQRMAAVREKGIAIDTDFNEFGIRRFAVAVLQDGKLAGVLAVAQRQTPRADSEIDLIQQTLQPPT